MELEKFRRMLLKGIGNTETRDITEKAMFELYGEIDDRELEAAAKRSLDAKGVLDREALLRTRKLARVRYDMNSDGTDAIWRMGTIYDGCMLSDIWGKDPGYVAWMRKTFGESMDPKCRGLIDLLNYIQSVKK